MSTLQEVAAAANVSATTVSRYLNKRIDLPPETTGRIDRAILDLDYRPNLLAKRLSLGKAEAIGLVAPDLANPFFAELLAAVEDEAEKHGYATFITSTRGNREREIASLERLRDRHVDGLIIMTNQVDDGSLARAINRQSDNVVLIDEDIPHVGVPKIFVENREGGYLATRHLLDKGHRRVAHIGGPADLFSGRERSKGFFDALKEAKLQPSPGHLRQGLYSREFGLDAMRAILASGDCPTAVFAGSDVTAIGVMQAVRERGLSVPDDISLVGFDDMPFADLLAPALTTIRQPAAEMGRAGLRALVALFQKTMPAAITRLPVTLIERNSVSPPRG